MGLPLLLCIAYVVFISIYVFFLSLNIYIVLRVLLAFSIVILINRVIERTFSALPLVADLGSPGRVLVRGTDPKIVGLRRSILDLSLVMLVAVLIFRTFKSHLVSHTFHFLGIVLYQSQTSAFQILTLVFENWVALSFRVVNLD